MNPNGSQPAAVSGSALYVDTENLREAEHAQAVVDQVISNWPANCPPLGSLSLYVRADKAELWQLWAETEFPALQVRVRGVQHFSNHRAKNSADLAITADAVADLISGQADSVAVVSNDSDFGALFVKVRELANAADAKSVPFLWITTPEGGGISDEIERFIPATFRWDLSAALTAPEVAASDPVPVPGEPTLKSLPAPARPAPPTADTDELVSREAIATELIRRLPIGKFKVTEAHDVFQGKWPKHTAASGPAQFGTFLLKEVWPILQKHGVLMTRKSSPRTYEITAAAKETLSPRRASPSQPPPPPEPAAISPEQLAAAVATGIADDVFSATQALAVLKASHPEHPAASYTAQRFGTWFAEQLWPIMEQHGVAIAKEKPRRYEMTPDARHNLIALA